MEQRPGELRARLTDKTRQTAETDRMQGAQAQLGRVARAC